MTSTAKHSLNPVFNESFTTEISLSEFKLIRLKVEVMDADRHTKTTEIGATSVALKDVKALRNSDQPVRSSYVFTPKKQVKERL